MSKSTNVDINTTTTTNFVADVFVDPKLSLSIASIVKETMRNPKRSGGGQALSGSK